MPRIHMLMHRHWAEHLVAISSRLLPGDTIVCPEDMSQLAVVLWLDLKNITVPINTCNVPAYVAYVGRSLVIPCRYCRIPTLNGLRIQSSSTLCACELHTADCRVYGDYAGRGPVCTCGGSWLVRQMQKQKPGLRVADWRH